MFKALWAIHVPLGYLGRGIKPIQRITIIITRPLAFYLKHQIKTGTKHVGYLPKIKEQE